MSQKYTWENECGRHHECNTTECKYFLLTINAMRNNVKYLRECTQILYKGSITTNQTIKDLVDNDIRTINKELIRQNDMLIALNEKIEENNVKLNANITHLNKRLAELEKANVGNVVLGSG